jgi:hypothetical protein
MEARVISRGADEQGGLSSLTPCGRGRKKASLRLIFAAQFHQHSSVAADAGDPDIRLPDADAERRQHLRQHLIDRRRGAADDAGHGRPETGDGQAQRPYINLEREIAEQARGQ